jgi:hypothetical protein
VPNQHKTPLLGWHPPAEDSAWVRAEAKRRDVDLKVVLNEMLSEYRARRSGNHPSAPVFLAAAEDEQPEPARRNCKHRNMRMSKGVCPDCKEWVSPAASRTNGGQ